MIHREPLSFEPFNGRAEWMDRLRYRVSRSPLHYFIWVVPVVVLMAEIELSSRRVEEVALLALGLGGIGIWLRRDFTLPGLAVLIPFAVLFVEQDLSQHRLQQVVGAGIALGIFALAVRRPTGALIALVVFLPLEGFGFGLLLGLHVPAELLRLSSSLKELLGISVLAAAIHHMRNTKTKLDKIDIAILLYVGAVTAYLLFPRLFSTTAPTSLTPRLLAWRADCAYVLLFFAVRHAPITTNARARVARAIQGVGWLIVAAGVYQRLRPKSFDHFVLHRAHQTQYLQAVLHEPNSQVLQGLHFITNPHPLHVTSIFLSPYDMADYLLLVVGVTLGRIGNKRDNPWNYILLIGSMAVIFFSEVRADLLAGIVILVIAIAPAAKRLTESRIRLGMVLLAAALIVAPYLGGTRFVNAQGGASSNQGHIREFENGVALTVHHPLGLGLGDQPATSSRFSTALGLQGENPTIIEGAVVFNPSYLIATIPQPPNVVSDSSIAQVSDELGLQGFIPWIALLVMVLMAVYRRLQSADSFAAGAGLAMIGLLIAGQFHHVFITFPLAWSLWACLALALNESPTQPEPGSR